MENQNQSLDSIAKLNQAKIKEMVQEMKGWDNKLEVYRPTFKTSKMAKALIKVDEALEEAEEIKKLKKEIIVWYHLVALTIEGIKAERYQGKISKKQLFKAVTSNQYLTYMSDIPEEYETDEEPTTWMIEFYWKFLKFIRKDFDYQYRIRHDNCYYSDNQAKRLKTLIQKSRGNRR